MFAKVLVLSTITLTSLTGCLANHPYHSVHAHQNAYHTPSYYRPIYVAPAHSHPTHHHHNHHSREHHRYQHNPYGSPQKHKKHHH